MQSLLEHQHKMLSDIINITKEIIKQQIVIKERTESLQIGTAELDVASKKLQQVLATSQEQLHVETSIPIELINQLATGVRLMKDSQLEGFKQLLLYLEFAHGQFETQGYIIEEKIEDTSRTKENKNQSNGIEAWTRTRTTDYGLTSRADSSTSTLSNHLTILDTCDDNEIEAPCEDPELQSELIHTKDSMVKKDVVDPLKIVTIGKYSLFIRCFKLSKHKK